MSSWSLEPIFDSYPTVIALCALLVGTLLVVRPWSSRSVKARQRALMALRAAAIVLVTVAMVRPTYVSVQNRPLSATLVLLFDASRSMNVQDEPGGETRWQRQQRTLRESSDAFASLADVMELQVFPFAEKLSDDVVSDGTLQLPTQAVGQESDLALALTEALRRETGKRLAAVVLMSDGAQRAIEPQYDLQQSAFELMRMNTPLYAVPFGKARDQSQTQDVAIERLQDQYTVFVKNELAIRGGLRVQGYVNRSIPVRLFIDGPDGAVVKTLGPLELQATQNDQLVDFDFQFSPETPGAYKLRVEAEAQDGELLTDNNQMIAYLNVLEGGLRILYVDGNLLGWEQKEVRESLAASPDIELDFRAVDPRRRASWPIDLSNEFAGVPYDVFLIGDVDADALGEENLRQIAQRVAGGAGLMMTGGVNTLGPGGYRGTPLAPLLPIQMGRLSRQPFGADQPIRPDVHLPGPIEMLPARRHFITNLDAGQDNNAAWRKLPPLLGANRFEGLSPQAIRLAETPAKEPLLIARQYDAGRVLIFAGDSTYRWVSYGFGEVHRRFWRQAMLWLANRDELLRRDVWVSIPRRRFRPGETVLFSAGARAENGSVLPDAQLTATLVHPGRADETISLSREGDDWSGALDEITEPGEYTVQVSAVMNGQPIGEASARFQMQKLDLELADPAANPRQLESLAATTKEAGGRVVPPEQFRDLLQTLRDEPPEMEMEVESKWQFGDTAAGSWLFFLVLVGVLGCEWFLRRKWGLN